MKKQTAQRHTFYEACVRWEQERTDKRSLDTDQYRMRAFMKYWRNKPLAEIDDAEVRRVRDIRRKEVAPATCNRELLFVKSLIKMAGAGMRSKGVMLHGWGWVSHEINVEFLREPKPRRVNITDEQLERLLSELPPHLRDMAEFSIMTGLREKNCATLEWGRIDSDRQMLWVDDEDSKNGEPMGIPLSDRAMEIIRLQKGKHPTRVFTYQGKPVRHLNNTAWKNACKRAGVKLRWHDLRHLFAIRHMKAGTPPLIVQQLGGWKTLDMVQRYSHLSTEALAAWSKNSNLPGHDK